MLIESTARCLRTRFVVFALEEAGRSFEIRVRPPGDFEREWNAIGPIVTDGSLQFLELNVGLCHIARCSQQLMPSAPRAALDAVTWLELQATWLRPAGVRLREAAQRGERDIDAERTFERCLTRHERALENQDYLVGDFSIADCTAPFLLVCRAMGAGLDGYPSLNSYLDRVEQRPAWQRAAARADDPLAGHENQHP